MGTTSFRTPDGIEIINQEDYYADLAEHFFRVPDVGQPLLQSANITLSEIERMLYSIPAFANVIKAKVPEER